jgi:hypothetical protein
LICKPKPRKQNKTKETNQNQGNKAKPRKQNKTKETKQNQGNKAKTNADILAKD